MIDQSFRAVQPRHAPELRVGIIPLPNFTMLAFAGFIDTLRLAADEGDRSRQVRCAWTVMSEHRDAVAASNGVMLQPPMALQPPLAFDYVIVVGGTLHDGERESAGLLSYLRTVDAAGVPLVGLCNGVFALARAGLMDGRYACLSWFHHQDYVTEFPGHRIVSDRMFLVDGKRITCPGGVGAIHLASWLIERHLGTGAAAKGLRIMLEDGARPGEAPQPAPLTVGVSNLEDVRVRRAVLAMERMLDQNVRLADLARMVGSTPRTLTRLFVAHLGITPAAVLKSMRVDRARRLLRNTQWSIAEIAADCGFCDASHLIRHFREVEGATPGAVRAAGGPHPASSG
ncbi:GlxA family transcriptional regulator [Sphingomonas sp. MG17]|uniref:GlxA family transcriptional regulator n=1 Tax=Sphingomonas tagetis TaxID=2949092 RepID=A0A9X2HSN5_9SPHN|nr:GlxA family transcriptional regulator [Sphingomonas tagetis]MCP3732768.1 GlxA family transcriptional regulator [Sphingomonas tagetis]